MRQIAFPMKAKQNENNNNINTETYIHTHNGQTNRQPKKKIYINKYPETQFYSKCWMETHWLNWLREVLRFIRRNAFCTTLTYLLLFWLSVGFLSPVQLLDLYILFYSAVYTDLLSILHSSGLCVRLLFFFCCFAFENTSLVTFYKCTFV